MSHRLPLQTASQQMSHGILAIAWVAITQIALFMITSRNTVIHYLKKKETVFNTCVLQFGKRPRRKFDPMNKLPPVWADSYIEQLLLCMEFEVTTNMIFFHN